MTIFEIQNSKSLTRMTLEEDLCLLFPITFLTQCFTYCFRRITEKKNSFTFTCVIATRDWFSKIYHHGTKTRKPMIIQMSN